MSIIVQFHCFFRLLSEDEIVAEKIKKAMVWYSFYFHVYVLIRFVLEIGTNSNVSSYLQRWQIAEHKSDRLTA